MPTPRDSAVEQGGSSPDTPDAPRFEAALTAATLLGMVILGVTVPFSDLAPIWTALGATVTWSPLILRWRFPLPVLAVVAIIDAVGIALVSDHTTGLTTVPLATMLALYTVAGRYPTRFTWAVAATTGAAQLGVALLVDPSGREWLYLNWVAVATVVGLLTRERRDRMAAAERRAETAERTRRAEAERQVNAERMRIARELHDVLAHHLAVINAQAAVAEYLLGDNPAAAASALKGITENSKAALTELRATLGLLRTDGEADESRLPTPGTDDLDQLLNIFTGAGMRLHVAVHGDAVTLNPVADLALYRIVQEALTNTTKHATEAPVDLTIEWSTDHVSVTIVNGSSSSPPATHGGYGLIGMRERAAAAGGTVTTEPTPDGGFRVDATLPYAITGQVAR